MWTMMSIRAAKIATRTRVITGWGALHAAWDAVGAIWTDCSCVDGHGTLVHWRYFGEVWSV